jgi:hypothetical protein
MTALTAPQELGNGSADAPASTSPPPGTHPMLDTMALQVSGVRVFVRVGLCVCVPLNPGHGAAGLCQVANGQRCQRPTNGANGHKPKRCQPTVTIKVLAPWISVYCHRVRRVMFAWETTLRLSNTQTHSKRNTHEAAMCARQGMQVLSCALPGGIHAAPSALHKLYRHAMASNGRFFFPFPLIVPASDRVFVPLAYRAGVGNRWPANGQRQRWGTVGQPGDPSVKNDVSATPQTKDTFHSIQAGRSPPFERHPSARSDCNNCRGVLPLVVQALPVHADGPHVTLGWLAVFSTSSHGVLVPRFVHSRTVFCFVVMHN